ncbi:toxin-antitoxin system TumE family protein [Methylomagnum sp.]
MDAHELVADRLRNIRGALMASPSVTEIRVLHEQALGNVGYFRIRGKLVNSDEFLFMERFRHKENAIVIEKYSFHWQRADGSLVRRWDNAPHHREIATFPHHLHEGEEANVLPHEAMDCFAMLRLIEKP